MREADHSMTDFSPTTHSQPAQTAYGAAGSSIVLLNSNVSSAAVAEAEDVAEDFTIKCICGDTDAGDNSVYCESCDTWQHTECYYTKKDGSILTPDELAHIEHLCLDCSPRDLDTKVASDRQKARQAEVELNEKKIKKSAAKSHKRKPKPAETNGVLANGWVHGNDPDGQVDRPSRSPRDNPPPSKRPKTSHRASNPTITSYQDSSKSHKRNASHVHSPNKASHRRGQSADDGENFSLEFLHLYDEDPGETPMQTNLLNDLDITSALSLWSNDIEALREATQKFSHPEIFQRTEQPISSMPMPEIRMEEKVGETTVNGRHPRWRYITVDSWTPKDGLVGEIKGKIGHMNEYIREPANRWEYLRHPAPFVFFHPRLPIYIDTRSEGTLCRYLRRSCSPNLAMKTILENGSEYHFCFTAQCNIEPGAELTIGWVPDEHMRRFFDPNHNGEKQEIGAEEEDYIADWASKVLPEFGGCACRSSHCTWARFSKRSHAPSKGRNSFPKNVGSNLVTNHTTTSREGSDRDDPRSSSDSKSESRDNTPTENQVNGGFGAGLEISARDKRKIAALEKNDRNQPAVKKKKRNSGGSTVNTPGPNSSKHFGPPASQPNTPGIAKPHYADASTSRRGSGSPVTKQFGNLHVSGRSKPTTASKNGTKSSLPVVRSPKHLKNYRDCGVQTDPDENDDWQKSSTILPTMKKPYISLTQRLLRRSQQERQVLEQRRRAALEITSGIPRPTDMNTNGSAGGHHVQGQSDAEMQDAGAMFSTHKPLTSPPLPQGQDPSLDQEILRANPTGVSLHSAMIAHETSHEANGLTSIDLPGQPPPKPPEGAFAGQNPVETPTSSGPHSPMGMTTTAAVTTLHPTTNTANIQPSPALKKMSLTEYLARKGSLSGAASASGGNDKSSNTGGSGNPGLPPPLQSPSIPRALSSSNTEQTSAAVGRVAEDGGGGSTSVTGRPLVNGDIIKDVPMLGGLGGDDSEIVDSPRKEIGDPMNADPSVNVNSNTAEGQKDM